jgi:hypothetical protein
MQENSLQAGQRLQGNSLESHLRTFVTSLLDDGYADATVHDKLSLLHRLGQWLRRTGRAVSGLFWSMPPNLVWLPAKKYHLAAIPFFA